MDFESRIEKFQKLINESSNIVFFGGAGVSTESGIPDFRSKDGLYNKRDVKFEKYTPEYLLSHSCLIYEPKVFYEFYKQKMNTSGIKPNITHKKLAELEAARKLKAVVTQNIDSLHELAGSKNVYKIHGTTSRAHCMDCDKEYDGSVLFNFEGDIPLCECGGMIRPDVTLYEEGLPKDAWAKSIDAIESADLLIIGGTSLMVYPANSLIRYYRGKDIVMINRDETEYDRLATFVFHENLGEVFDKIDL